MFVLSLSYFENIMSLLNEQQKKKAIIFCKYMPGLSHCKNIHVSLNFMKSHSI